MKAIVLAGGGGTRLWPLSREDFPKQFLKFGSELSLLQKTVQRLTSASFITEVVVATNEHHFSLVQEQLQKISCFNKVQVLIEPLRKNTAPAIALAVKYLQAKDTDSVLVVPSDHLIEPESIFLNALEQMEDVSKEGGIITFGIRPTRPETGYGYIQIGAKKNAFVFQAKRFVEKPNQATAQTYLEDPHFYWNSGMFIFSVATFWKELKQHAPDIHRLISASYDQVIAQFDQMPDLSIDYAVMEKSKNISVYPLAVQWSDVGSWDSVYDAMDKDLNQNVKVGQVLDVDTKNSLIISGKRLISTIGLEDMLIVETEDALFVGKKGQSQRMKGLVQDLVKKGLKQSVAHAIQTHPWGLSHLLDEKQTYCIKKVQLNAGQKILAKEEPIPLTGELVIESGYICNHTDEPIEFLIIEKKVISSDAYLETMPV